MKRLTDTFRARGDDGRDYTIRVYTEFKSAGSEMLAGLKELRTAEGDYSVNYLEKGVYQIVATRVVLRSDAPNAL